MKKIAKKVFPGILMLSFLFLPFAISNSSSHDSFLNLPAKTLEHILEKRKTYFEGGFGTNRIISILIVPGHDDGSSGAYFNGIREVEFNREVAQKLYDYLILEPGINPILAHKDNDYISFIKNAFVFNRPEIEKFIDTAVDNFKEIREDQDIVDPGFHNAALPEARYRLYGINWWANRSDIDLVIHIHFNDYRDRPRNGAGKYDGFSIYIPGEHFQNYELSKKLGEAIFEEVKKIRPVSNLPYEEDGIIEGHELIAIGSNDSVRSGSVLIEYGYMYEDVFQDETKRDITFDYLAYSTYVGIKNLLQEKPLIRTAPATQITNNKTTQDNLIWQFERAMRGLYPPTDKTLRDCPITGFFGECSRAVR